MLKLEGVGSAYGASQVLWDVNLSVAPGEAVTLLGRNGVGKTTLLRTIVGVHPLKGGTISFEGTPVGSSAAYRRARLGIAYVPQGRGIFPHLSVAENLALGLASVPGRAGKKADVPEYVFELFPVLGEMLTRKGGDLSGGQQQQLALGRALAARPKLLLLDEPTEGVQPSIVQQIEVALHRVHAELGVSVLLVEQYLDFAWRFAERYLVMQRGRVIAAGDTAGDGREVVARLLSV